MSDLDPTGPSQPTLSQAYTTPGNPASKEPAEARQASQNAQSNKEFAVVDQRIPKNQASGDEAVPSALGRGVRGAGPGEEAEGKAEEEVGRHNELDADQMAAPGEGAVRDAVEGKDGRKGASGQQEDLAADMERYVSCIISKSRAGYDTSISCVLIANVLMP